VVKLGLQTEKGGMVFGRVVEWRRLLAIIAVVAAVAVTLTEPGRVDAG